MAFRKQSETAPETTETVLETAPEETLEQLLTRRYDVEKLSDVLAENFVERLDNAVISKVKAKLLNRPAPINVPFVVGNFLAGVSYEN